MRQFALATLLLFVYASAARAQDTTAAVMPLQMRGLMPVVEVKLNGQGPFAFMIDTGAGMQADIDVSVATRLSLRANGRVINGDPSGINDREVSTTTIDSLTLGRGDSGASGVEFRNVTAVV